MTKECLFWETSSRSASQELSAFYGTQTLTSLYSRARRWSLYAATLTLRRLMSYIYMEHPFLMFLDHTQRRSTVGRTPLDEWSARRRNLYLTTDDTHNRQISMPPVGFEPKISAGKRPCRSPAEIVGLLWTSDQVVAETSTWQHTTLTTDKYPCPRWDSNPRFQQVSGLRSLCVI